MTERPGYKSHPFWQSAMALTRHAYALAKRLEGTSPGGSRRFRKTAVAVPAHVAAALSGETGRRRDHLPGSGSRLKSLGAGRAATARAESRALAELTRPSERLAREAETLELSALFEFGSREAR